MTREDAIRRIGAAGWLVANCYQLPDGSWQANAYRLRDRKFTTFQKSEDTSPAGHDRVLTLCAEHAEAISATERQDRANEAALKARPAREPTLSEAADTAADEAAMMAAMLS